MLEKIIGIVVQFVITGALGYAVASAKAYRDKLKKKEENEQLQNSALLTLLQAQLTNIYFEYAEKQEISDYIYKNWLNMFKIYKALGGNDYIDELKHKMDSWKIVKTGILLDK
jgi:plasmid replication initiation protein